MRWMNHNYNQSELALTYNDVQVVPEYNTVETRENIKTRTCLVGDIYIDHPLIPANMDTIAGLDMVNAAWDNGSFCFFHRFGNINDLIQDITSHLDHMNINNPSGLRQRAIGVSLGTKYYDAENAQHVHSRISSLDPNCKVVFLIDVAHGHHKTVIDMVKRLRVDFPYDYIIAGNIATYGGALALIEAGANGIKVGVGPGSLCSTRIETGAGVPQFTAVMEAWRAIVKAGSTATLIADGGVKFAGDIVKAIGAGANTVMSGYLFAGTDSTPGDTEYDAWNGTLEKVYRGSASRESKLDRGETKNIEGVATRVSFKGRGSTQRVFSHTRDGIRSGLSYAGFNNLEEAVGNMTFVRVSQASIIEASPNAVR